MLFFIALLFFSCNSKPSFVKEYEKGNYNKAISLYLSADSTKEFNNVNYNQIMYECYKGSLDVYFGWKGPVRVLNMSNLTELTKERIMEFEILLAKMNNDGILGAVKFRTGRFQEAYNIYKNKYITNPNTTIDNDLKASLAGMLVDKKDTYENLYYKSNNIINTIGYDFLSIEQKEYIDDYYRTTQNIDVLNILIVNKKNLDDIEKKHNLTKKDFLSLYKSAIENDNIAKAEIISYKLNSQEKMYADFMKISFAFSEKEYTLSQKLITQFKHSYKNCDEEWLYYINVFDFYSKFFLNDIVDLLRLYLEIEDYIQINDGDESYEPNDFYYNNDDSSEEQEINIEDEVKYYVSKGRIWENGKFGIRNGKFGIRKVFEALIRDNDKIEKQVLELLKSNKTLAAENNTLLHEMLLNKYIFQKKYDDAYFISNKMINGLLYGETVSEETFLKLYDILEILFFSKNKTQLFAMRKQIILNMEVEMKDLVNEFNVFKTREGKRYISSINYQIEQAFETINSSLNKSNPQNILYLIEDTDVKLGYSNAINFAYRLTQILQQPTKIFSDKIDFQKQYPTQDNVADFYDYNENYIYSELHYNAIKLNIILECLHQTQDKDYIFYYFSSFFPNILQKNGFITDLEENKKRYSLTISKCINQINIGSKNKNQIYFYTMLKNKLKKMQKDSYNYQITLN